MAEVTADLGVYGRDPDIRHVNRRTVLFVRGDPGDVAYAVKSGAVEVRGAGRLIRTVGPGEIFGEMALIDGMPRSASAVALADSELIVIDPDCFLRLIGESPDFPIMVMRVLAQRLRETDSALFAETEELPLGTDRLAG